MRWSAFAWMLSALCFCVAPAARADSVRLSMSASANRVQVGEPFAIEIRAELSGSQDDDTEIDLPEFEHFEVLGRRVSRPFSFSFGFGGGQQARVQSELIYSFTLRAPSAGRFVIQPAVITVGGRKYASRPLTIEVSGTPLPSDPNVLPGQQSEPLSSTDPQGQAAVNPLDGARFDPDMFVRTAVDRHRAYVGEQVTVTIYLYVRGGLRETPMVSREATNEGFWTQDLLPPQRSLSATRQEVNGRVFSAYVLRRYAAFPMRPGKLEIGPPSVETSGGGSLFDLFAGPSQPVRRNGVPVSIDVAELPARKNEKLPLHVGTLSLAASLEPAGGKVGDAITLRVVAKGQGNLRALKLEAPPIAGVEVLPPEIDDKVTTDLDLVGGERSFRWLLLPREPGTHVVAPVVVDVFDPKTGTYSPVQSNALPFQVTGTPASVPTLAAPSGPNAPPTKGADDASAGESRPAYGPVRARSELLRATSPLHAAPWFGWALLAGPLALILGGVGQRTGRWLAGRKQVGHNREQAFKVATSQLERARDAVKRGDAQEVLSALSQALKGALEARLGEPIGGLTRKALRGHLEQRGMVSSLAASLVGELEQLDQARFAPAPKGAAELEQLLSQTNTILKDLERFTAKASA